MDRQFPMPIIVGVPRSGTTLLRLMLDSHRELAIPPETGFLHPACDLKRQGRETPEDVFQLVTSFPPDAPCWPDFNIDANRFRDELHRIRPFEVASGMRAFYRLYAERFNKQRFGDKTPSYCEHIERIGELLPEAHFLHIIRDGRDVALSLRPLWFSPGHDIETLARYWSRMVRAGRAGGSNARAYMEVRYEDLVREPRPQLEAVCRFLQLPFHSEMVEYWLRAPERLREHQARLSADGAALVTHAQRLNQQRLTAQPPQPQRVFRWKTDMIASERGEFQRAAGGTLAELGYES
jgi:Sulfotransferase family